LIKLNFERKEKKQNQKTNQKYKKNEYKYVLLRFSIINIRLKMSKKYNIRFFKDILYEGFDFVLPEETVKLIHSLSSQVGSPNYIKTPVFKKRDILVTNRYQMNNNNNNNHNNPNNNNNHNNNHNKFVKINSQKRGVEG
jgi:hypothetical protein